MYKQCTTRWAGERRCERHRQKTAYFDDNCPLSCGHCQPGPLSPHSTTPRRPQLSLCQLTELDTPIPILAEPLAWLMGRWEAESRDGKRYPLSLGGPYRETLIVKPEKITMFDRPSLNVRYHRLTRHHAHHHHHHLNP